MDNEQAAATVAAVVVNKAEAEHKSEEERLQTEKQQENAEERVQKEKQMAERKLISAPSHSSPVLKIVM